MGSSPELNMHFGGHSYGRVYKYTYTSLKPKSSTINHPFDIKSIFNIPRKLWY